MLLIVCPCVIPRERPASVCPALMDKIPPRTISAMYAPLLIPNAIVPTIHAGILVEANMIKLIIRSCTIVGVPRITSMYIPETAFSSLLLERRINAIITPITSPSNTEKNDINNVLPNPLTNQRHLPSVTKVALKRLSISAIHTGIFYFPQFIIFNMYI